MSFWKNPFRKSEPAQPPVPPRPDWSQPLRERDCSEDPKPHFRFYPDVYADGVFDESDEPCSLCGCPCGWTYTGSVYGPRPEHTCARCLADGTLGAEMHDCVPGDDVDEALWAEAMTRTPGIATYNPFVWPVIAGQPLVYLGHADTRDLASNAQARQAMTEAAKALEWDDIASHNAMVFRSLDGSHWRVELDLD